MEAIALTSMSSKGQIVIPVEMREDFAEGEKFIVIKTKNQVILKRAKDFEKNLEQDLKFAKRTEEAFKRYERGKFKSMSGEEFLKELSKW